MTTYLPKQLIEKEPDYQNDSFASWLEKTLFTTIEVGDLNLLNPKILNVLKSAAQASDDIKKINLVAAINETHAETRRVLIRAIAMS
jgi:hypothetical protein